MTKDNEGCKLFLHSISFYSTQKETQRQVRQIQEQNTISVPQRYFA